MMQVKIISVQTMKVQKGEEKSLEDQVNEFIKTVIPTQYSYSTLPGYQSVLIAYDEKPKAHEWLSRNELVAAVQNA